MAFSSSLKAEFAFARSISIRFFTCTVIAPVPSLSCSRKCSTLMLAKSWQRPLATTYYALQHNHDQRRSSSACPWNNVDHCGDRLNITRAVVSKELEYPDAYKNNEDYDEDNLHMTLNSVTSQDREQLGELDMALPECEALQYDCDLRSVLEEDWETSRTQQTGLNKTIDEVVLDIVDDDDC